MSIKKDISQLLEAKIIDNDTALSIKEFYGKENRVTKTLFFVH